LKVITMKKLVWWLWGLSLLVMLAVLLQMMRPVPRAGFEATKAMDDHWVFEGGEMVLKQGIPTLTVAGSEYEMGLQYGVLLKDQLHAINRESRSFLRQLIPWYAKPFSNFYFNWQAGRIKDRIPQRYQEELRGIAAGAGLREREVWLFASFPEIFLGCTSILTRVDGEVILARNLDFLPFLGKYPVVVHYHPIGKTAFTSIGVTGYGGVLTGFNTSGIGLSLNTIVMEEKTPSKEVLMGYQNRHLLETSGSLSEADELLRDFSSEVGWAVSIASSADQNGAVYEIASSGIRKHDLDDRDFLVVNNSFLDEDLRHRHMGVLTAASFRNQGRHEALKAQLQENPVSHRDDLMDLLASVQFYAYDDIGLGWGHYTVNNEQTIQSILMDTHYNEFWLAVGEGFAGFSPYLRYDLHHRSGSFYREGRCESAVLELLERRDRIMECYLASEYQGLADMIRGMETPSRYEMAGLAEMILEEDVTLDRDWLKAVIESERNRFDQLPELAIANARILLAEGRWAEAAETLATALTMAHLYEADQVMIYRYLAEALHKTGDQEKAREYAKRCLAMMEGYAIGEDEEALVEAVRPYLE
jgi:predicted choloylglycine hydrolase